MTTPDVDRAPVLGRITRLLAPYRRPLLVVLAAVVVQAGLTAFIPFLTRAVFDDALFPLDGGPADLGLLGWLAAGMITLPVVAGLIGVAQTYLTLRIGNSAMADLRGDLFAHLQTLELAFFTSTRTGSIQSRLSNDVAGVRTVLTDTARTIVTNAVIVAASLVSMLILSWQLTILSLILMPLFVWIQIGVGRRRQRLARRTQESLADMTAITEESLSVSGVLLAKSFDRGGAETLRYRDENARQTVLQVRSGMAGQTFFALVGTFFAIVPAILYLAAGLMLDGGTSLTAGTLVAFTTLQAALRMPLLQLMRVGLDVQTSLALFRRIFEYLDLESTVVDRPDAIVLDPDTLRGEVTLDGVWFRYPPPRRLQDAKPLPMARGGPSPASVATGSSDGETPSDADDEPGPWILRDVSFTASPGCLVALVGPSGSGKTTTSYLVPRFYDTVRGAVRIDGLDVRDVTQASLARAVGVVTQEAYLFHASVRANIAYARPDASDAEIEQAARDADIHDRIVGFAEGYETIVGERGYRLSGGEKQRLALARVLLADPRVLILDEATSALDSETERVVQQALDRARVDRTTIAIAHRLSTIRDADLIVALEDGEVVETGTHDELLVRDGLYARLWREQQREARPAGRAPHRVD